MAGSNRRTYILQLLIIGGLFFVFGFITWLNGSLIPFLQIACELTQMQAYLVTFAFYISYTVMALPAALVLRRVGYKNGLALGLLIMAVGALIFIPAAFLRLYSVFLVGLLVLGSGLTLLQISANPYIVLIGPVESAAARFGIMGLLNKGAGIVAPVVFTAWVLGDFTSFTESNLAMMTDHERDLALGDLAQRLIQPYLILAGSLAVLAIYICLSPLPSLHSGERSAESSSFLSIFRYPNVVLGTIAVFACIGAEVLAGDTIGLFGRELGINNFGQLTAYKMAFMMCGYVLGMILIPRLVSQEAALAASALLGIILAISITNSSLESVDLWSTVFGWLDIPVLPNVIFLIALLGLANALLWPAIWPLALKGLAPTQIGAASALLIMGIAGGALLPIVFGAIADTASDSRTAYWVILPCYLYILLFALVGHKLERWSPKMKLEANDNQ